MLLPSIKRGPGRPRTQSPDIRVTLITNDYQIPFMDHAVYLTVVHFLQDLQPDYHIINGDFLDMFSLSRFDKNPMDLEAAQSELDMANEVLDQLSEVSPTTITKITMGNHEARLNRKLMETPELWSYVVPTKKPEDLVARVLSLPERGIGYVPYPDHFNHYGFIVTHGQATGLNPAKKEMERYGVSGCSGHVNKNSSWETKNQHGHCKWWSLGGLTTHKMAFMPVNNWVHGIGVLYQVVGGDLFSFYQIEIANAKFVFNGKMYTPDGVFSTDS